MLGSLVSGGGGGFSGGSSSAKTSDMSSMSQSSGGGQGVGAVNVGGDAASSLQRPWYMGGADWEQPSPAAGKSVTTPGAVSRDSEGEGRDVPAWVWWAGGGLGVLAVGALGVFAMRGG